MTESLPSRERGLKSSWPVQCRRAFRSLPSRERGLKFDILADLGELLESLPSRERGLKSDGSFAAFVPDWVAPFTGAWIEIEPRPCRRPRPGVAPFTGAWIEIDQHGPMVEGCRVAPFTGAWIEIIAVRPYSIWHDRRSLHGSVD